MIAERIPLRWYYKDEWLTDFTLEGDLLTEAEGAEKEYRIAVPFQDKKYRLDIAIIGKDLLKEPIVLGGIEIEDSHEAEITKTLLCKSLGFPLFTLDVKDVALEDIDESWCIERLTETKITSEDGTRKNYIYLHNLLYPLFLGNCGGHFDDEKHIFVIFIQDSDLDKLQKWIESYKKFLSLSRQDVDYQIPALSPNDKGSVSMFENDGALTGENWRAYNKRRYMKLILKRPSEMSGHLYIFHLVIARILALHLDCLVGYKYERYLPNSKHKNMLWTTTVRKVDPSQPRGGAFEEFKLCPKRLSEPVREIIRFISDQQNKL